MYNCRVRQAGDSTWCMRCGLRWDTNDSVPPGCPHPPEDDVPLHTLQSVRKEAPQILRLRVVNGWIYSIQGQGTYVPDGVNELDAGETARVRRTTEEIPDDDEA